MVLFRLIIGCLGRLCAIQCENYRLLMELDLEWSAKNLGKCRSFLFPFRLIVAACLGACLVHYLWAPLICAGDRSKQFVNLALQSRELGFHC